MAQKTTSSIKTSKILIGAAGTDLNTLTIGSNETNTSFVFLSGNKVVFEFGTLQQTIPVVNPETGTSTVTTTGSDGTVTTTTTDNTTGQVIETVQTVTEGTVTTVTTTSNTLGTVTEVATDSATGTVTTTLYDLSYTFVQSTAVTAPDATTGYVTTTVTSADGSATETVTDPNNGNQQITQTLISAPSSTDGSYTRTTTHADGRVVEELYDNTTDTLIRTTTTSAPDADGNTTVTVIEHTVSTIEDQTTVVAEASEYEYVDRVLFQELTAGSTSYGSGGITLGGKTYVTQNVGRVQTDANGKNYLEMNSGQFQIDDFVSDATLMSHTFYFVVRPQSTAGQIFRFLWDPSTHAFNVEINYNPNKTGFFPLEWTTVSPTYVMSTTFNPQDAYTIVAMRLQYVSAIQYKADIRFVAKPGASYITAGSTEERTVSSPTVLGKKFYLGGNSTSATMNFKLYEFGVINQYLDATAFNNMVESLKTNYYGA